MSQLDQMCWRLASIEAPLDDLARARAEDRLLASLGTPLPRARRRWPYAAAAAVVVAAAAAAVVMLRPARVPVAVAHHDVDLTIAPFVVTPIGDVAGAPPQALIEPGTRLEVPAGWLVRARIGDQGTVAVVGPATLTVHGDRLSFESDGGGELLGTTAHGLHVDAPGATMTVTQAVFAVSVEDHSSRVAVLRGELLIDHQRVSAGDSWRVGDAATAPIDATTAAALAEHAHIEPPREPSVGVDLAGDPVTAEVWVGELHLARTPAWVRLSAGSVVRLSATGHVDTTVQVPAQPVARTVVTYTMPSVAPPTIELVAPPTIEPVAPPTSKPRKEVAPPKVEAIEVPVEARIEPLAPPETAESLYRDADRALADGDRDRARSVLLAVVTKFPEDRLGDAARYELADMAHDAGEDRAALRYLAAIDEPSLAEPVGYLRCRILVAGNDGGDACLADFRTRFPRSAHDAAALTLLWSRRYDAGDCAGARPLLDEYLRRYPKARAAAAARDRLARCK